MSSMATAGSGVFGGSLRGGGRAEQWCAVRNFLGFGGAGRSDECGGTGGCASGGSFEEASSGEWVCF